MPKRKICKSWLLCVLLILPLLSTAAGKCERIVATGNPEYPPYLWRDPSNPQQLIGANADLLKHLAKELNITIDVLYTGPWSRAQEEVRTGRVDMAAGAFLTLPRLATMDFMHPPLYVTPSVVWQRRGAEFPYAGWEDLRGRTGDTLINNSFGQDFDEFAKANLTLEGVASVSQAFKKLLLGRTDYVVFERYPGQALAAGEGLDDELHIMYPPVSSEGLYITLSHNSACNDAWLRGKLALKLTEAVANGVPQALLQRNLQLWKEQQLHPAGEVKP